MNKLTYRQIIVLLVVIVTFASPIWAKSKRRTQQQQSRFTDALAQKIVTRAKYYGLDPFLVLEVMRQESQFNPQATSSMGARGLMQFMPGTAARFGMNNAYDPDQAIDAGCRYLASLIRQFDGRVDLVLAGYNAGEHNVVKHGYKVPPFAETRNYVYIIIHNYKRALEVAAQIKRGRVPTRQLSPQQVKERLAQLDQQLALLR